MFKSMFAALGVVVALAYASPAAAAEWVLTRTVLGCNGMFCGGGIEAYVAPVDGGFKLVGDDVHHLHTSTTYTTIAEATGTFSFTWDYYNYEPPGFGSYQDPAGYVIDGIFTQLTQNILYVPPGFPGGGPRAQSGNAALSVTAGQTFGFYVNALDGGYGPGEITIRQLGVPEPGAWALMILGLGGIGVMFRRRPTWISSTGAAPQPHTIRAMART